LNGSQGKGGTKLVEVLTLREEKKGEKVPSKITKHTVPQNTTNNPRQQKKKTNQKKNKQEGRKGVYVEKVLVGKGKKKGNPFPYYTPNFAGAQSMTPWGHEKDQKKEVRNKTN